MNAMNRPSHPLPSWRSRLLWLALIWAGSVGRAGRDRLRAAPRDARRRYVAVNAPTLHTLRVLADPRK